MTTIITPDNVVQFFKDGPTDRPPLQRATLTDAIVRGVTFRVPVRLDNPKAVRLEGCSFVGDAAKPSGVGLDVVGARDLRLTKTKWSGLAQAAKLHDCVDLTIADFECSDIIADGIFGGSLKNFLLENGRFWNWRTELANGKHADSIQLARPSLTARTVASCDGVIRGMSIVVRNTQGVFIPEQKRVLVENCAVCTDLGTAFGAANSEDITFRNNHAFTNPPSTTLARWDVREAVGVKWEGDNIEHAYGARKGQAYSRAAAVVDPAMAQAVARLTAQLEAVRAAIA